MPSPRSALPSITTCIGRGIVLVLLLAAQACAAAGDAAAVTGADGRLVVNGQAEIRVAPDRASFGVGVGNDGTEADAVLEENAQRTAALIDALRGSGIDIRTLRTQGVSLQPRWSSRPRDPGPDWTPKVVGYHASNRVELVTADLARVGELMALAVGAGASDLQGVQFSLEDDADARRRAIEDATRQAFDQAGILARAAHVATGAVLELRLDNASTDLPMPRPMERAVMMMADAKAATPVPVEPGEITVRAAVTLTLAVGRNGSGHD